MGYLGEFRANWRVLSAVSLGLAVGYTLNNYLTNIFSPHLIKAFGWAKSDFALLGLAVLVAVLVQPAAGRLTDAVGVRRMATVGVICSPLMYIAYSRMTGDFALFFLLYITQIIIV